MLPLALWSRLIVLLSACRRAQNRHGGNRILDRVLIRDLLSPLSYAPPLQQDMSCPVGPKGVEPLPFRLKGGSAAVTPRPRVLGEAYAFEPGSC